MSQFICPKCGCKRSFYSGYITASISIEVDDNGFQDEKLVEWEMSLPHGHDLILQCDDCSHEWNVKQ